MFEKLYNNKGKIFIGIACAFLLVYMLGDKGKSMRQAKVDGFMQGCQYFKDKQECAQLFKDKYFRDKFLDDYIEGR